MQAFSGIENVIKVREDILVFGRSKHDHDKKVLVNVLNRLPCWLMLRKSSVIIVRNSSLFKCSLPDVEASAFGKTDNSVGTYAHQGLKNVFFKR